MQHKWKKITNSNHRMNTRIVLLVQQEKSGGRNTPVPCATNDRDCLANLFTLKHNAGYTEAGNPADEGIAT
jgi:hypothetical protein